MKLSYRFALISLLALLLVLIGFTLSLTDISRRIADANAQHAHVNERTAEAAIDSVSELHKLFVRDYSFWDDMADAVTKKDTDWIAQEFFGPLEIYHADAAWVIDSEGALLFESESEKPLQPPVPLAQIPTIAKPSELTTVYGFNSERLITYHIGPVLYHTQPEKNTRPLGYVIVGIRWKSEMIAQLSKLLQAQVSVSGTTKNVPSLTSSQLLNRQFVDHNGNAVATMTIHFNDRSIALLTELFERESKRTAFLGVLGIFTTIIMLKHMIVKPINKLIGRLRKLSGDQAQQIVKLEQSEFAILSNLIDVYAKQADRIKDKNMQLHARDKELSSLVSELRTSEAGARRLLRDSLKLAKAVESSTDAIIITNHNGEIQYVNPTWVQLNGYSMREAMGKKPSMLKSNRTNTNIYHHLWKHLKNGQSYTSEDVINRRKDGSLYAARISVFPVSDGGRTLNYVGIAQDISVRKEREHLKSEFISLASHQLRTPLTTLRWLSEMLRRDSAKNVTASQLSMIKDIELSSVRMIGLVNRLLNLSRIETGRLSIKPVEIKMSQLIKDIRSELDSHFKKKNQRLLVRVQHEARVIHTDYVLLREVITNLLTNSCKYTPSRGTIGLRIVSKGEDVQLTVVDTGVGIPAAEVSSIFKRFFRASNALEIDQQGTGLGLYMVKLLVEALGGEITLDSVEGKGTEIKVTIPKKGVRKTGEIGIIKSKFVDP